MTGEPAAAVAALSAALGTDPGRGDLWAELATALVAAGRPQEAWDAAARAVELAPRSAAAHRAIGTVAAALGDARQAESAYRYALRLDPADHGARAALAGLAGPAGRGPRRVGSRHAVAESRHAVAESRHAVAESRHAVAESRHAAADEDEPSTGRHRPAEPSTGRHGVAEPSAAGWRQGPESEAVPGGGAPGAAAVGRATAVGLPRWLAPDGTRASLVPVGATRVVDPGGRPPAGGRGGGGVGDPAGWRAGLVTVVRVEWLSGVACFVGLAYGRTAPYTAGLLAGALVVAAAYGRVRWQAARTRRPPTPDTVPTYLAAAAVATAVVVVPATMAGALTVARAAAAAAVTCATAAAVLIRREAG